MSFGEAHTTRLQKGIFPGQTESHNPERLAVPFDDKQCLAVRRACLVGNPGRVVPLVAPPRLHQLSGEEPLSSSVPVSVSTRSSNSPSGPQGRNRTCQLSLGDFNANAAWSVLGGPAHGMVR
jgi:hypothetical protein